MTKKIFPNDFFWGASTASHQVEGKTINQWTVWELANASSLSKQAKQRLDYLDNWQDIEKHATSPSNYVSGKGVDHYNRYKEDFGIAKQLNLNAFRFGIEWSRIEPSEGEWDDKEIAHYQEYIAELKRNDLEPFLNIWHWTMPVWFTDKGGFEKSKNLKYWKRYVQKIIDIFGDEFRYIITINEPNVYSTFSYILGEWPPNTKNPITGALVYINLIRAHKIAYKIIKKKNTAIQVGVASQLANIQAKRPRNIVDVSSTQFMRYWWNWWFLNRIRKQQDFVGFNYYLSDYYKNFTIDNPKAPVSDLGWYMEPEGLYQLLTRVWSHYKKPIIITENGLADSKDTNREWWIEETIVAMERALSEGIQLKGYFHWSLLDNFEWKYGWWPEFGLVKVDRSNSMKRTVRPSAIWYKNKIELLKKGSAPTESS